MESLVDEILAKKELSNLGKDLVKEKLDLYFKTNPDSYKKIEAKKFNKRSDEFKKIVKEIRKQLREIYGVFIQKDYQKREKLLSELNTHNEDEIISKILELHQSSKERLPYYRDLFKKIFEITGKPKKIVDLACGLNPIAYPWMNIDSQYLASDISEEDMKFIQSFFDKEKIKGQTEKIDLISDIDKVDKIDCDICFLLKALDSLETRKKHISKEIIEKINTKYFVISFPKVSIGGNKNIKVKKRHWLLKFLENKGFSWEEFEIPNEYFVVVKK